jgi:hypothetical protein
MLPGSPSLPRAVRHGAVAALLLAALVAAQARALEATADTPRVRGRQLWCDVRLSDLFDARVQESLERGMPATLELHAELWRRRTGWFDRLESSFDASVRIRYEIWTRTWYVERAGAVPLALGDLDSVATVLSRPLVLPVARVDRLIPGSRCYVVVVATLRPLSVEDVEEVEGWLSGEVETKRHEGFGVITELPRSLFDAVRNFAGFGDQRARAVSPEFVPSDAP